MGLHEHVLETLKTIYDPEIPVNIYDLGLIYEVTVSDQGAVFILMTLTTPTCPVAQSFPGLVQDRILAVPGVTAATVEITWDPPWTKDRMSEIAKLELNLF